MLECGCPARHVRVTIQGGDPQEGVHVIDWDTRRLGNLGGPCPRSATQEDGKCDECRVFLRESREVSA